MKPRLLDLFCGAGGAATGYHRAGFEVVGVDHVPQPRYPFRFVQSDAFEYLRGLWASWEAFGIAEPERYDAIHASPPCQHFTKYGNSVKDIKDRYLDLLEPTRNLLRQTGLPYVIENVERAPMIDPLLLCGSMFDADYQRHRLFESNCVLQHPTWPCRHKIWAPNRFPGGRWKARKEKDPTITPSTPVRQSIEIGRWGIPLERQKKAMGIDWKITVRELSEAIPPVYTEFIGHQLMAHVNAQTVA